MNRSVIKADNWKGCLSSLKKFTNHQFLKEFAFKDLPVKGLVDNQRKNRCAVIEIKLR